MSDLSDVTPPTPQKRKRESVLFKKKNKSRPVVESDTEEESSSSTPQQDVENSPPLFHKKTTNPTKKSSRYSTPDRSSANTSSKDDSVQSSSSNVSNEDYASLVARIQYLEEQLKGKNNKKVKTSVKASKTTRSYFREGYKSRTADKTIKEWIFSEKGPFTTKNIATTRACAEFAKGLDNTITDEEINDAAKTFFASRIKYSNLKKKNPRYLEDSAERSRKVQKLKCRKKALKAKTSFSEETREKYSKALKLEFMSSEEEDEDGNFIIRPKAWRSRQMDSLCEALDKKWAQVQTKKSSKQTCKRTMGTQVTRGRPDDVDTDCEWVIREGY